jgi:hypothetical protein
VASCRTDEDADTRHASLRTLLDWVRHRVFPYFPTCRSGVGDSLQHLQSSTLASFYEPTVFEPNLGNQAHGKAVRVVTTRAVSGVLPDLPRYPSHTPNGQHFEVTTARSTTACKGAPVQAACLRRTTTPLRSKGALACGASTSRRSAAARYSE